MIVLGLGFGDEGKGLTTSFLCSKKRNPIVVRFNGGHQAGHTVVHEGKRHVFSTFGSGTLQGVPTYLSKFCTFFPTAFVNERKLLNNPTLFVNPLCPVTTPYDVKANQFRENELNHGSVGVGFGTTIQRQENYYKLFVQDLFHPTILRAKLSAIRDYYTYCNFPDTVNIDNFLDDIEEVKKHITVSGDGILNNFTPIFEGAQGIMLDQDFGFFPNVTRSNTTSKNAIEIMKGLKGVIFPEIYYVTRAYQTRHGNGFMTNEEQELKLINNENETNVTGKYQGHFRTAPLDTDLINYALECDHHFSKGIKRNLVITCTDQIETNVEEILSKLKVKFNNVYLSSGPSLADIKLYEPNVVAFSEQ